MMRRLRRPLIVVSAMVAVLAVLPSQLGAHGDQDQFLTGDPGCLAATMRATASSGSSPRQEFVPSALGTGLQSVDLCLTMTSNTNIVLSVRSGTAAAPGAVLATVNTTALSGTRLVHFELASMVPTTAGTTYLLEVSALPPLSWRGTCTVIAGSCTSVDPDLYPAGVSNSSAVRDFWFRTYSSTDADSDGIADPIDNCQTTGNPGQENADGNFIDQSPPKMIDDLTRVNSDNLGDACDDDDDNDGLPDTTEISGPPCASASGPTDELLDDTDGDLTTDSAECALATNPNDPGSKPSLTFPPGTDNDGDKLSNAFEGTIGTDPDNPDSDGDGLRDGVEFKSYGSNSLADDTDGDGESDDCEAASLNTDTVVNPGDQALLASEILRLPPPAKLANYDINKDTVLNPGDQAFQSSRAIGGVC